MLLLVGARYIVPSSPTVSAARSSPLRECAFFPLVCVSLTVMLGSCQHYFLTVAPASSATAASVVCVAFNPSRKSASEYVLYKSVGWCHCGSHPFPICVPRSFSRTLSEGTSSMNELES